MEEMTSAFDGYNAVHVRLSRALSVCKDMLETLHAAAHAFGEFELPPPTEEQMEQRRAWVRLDDIRGVPPAKNEGQRWESDYAKNQREEANAAWREELEAARAKAADGDVFTPGGEG